MLVKYFKILSFSSLSSLYLVSYWRIVALQCCVNFCYTTKWFSYTHIGVCMCVYIYIYPFKYSFPFSLSEDIKYSSLCYRVGPCLSVLNVVVWLSNPRFLIYPSSICLLCSHKSVLCVCEPVSVLCIRSFVSYFRILHINDIMWYLYFSFWLISLSVIIFQVHPCYCKWHYFICFYGWVVFICNFNFYLWFAKYLLCLILYAT